MEEFESPGAPAAGRDALLDYYHALACHESHLLIRADRLFQSVGTRAGPRLAEKARAARSDIAALLSSEPATGSIDRYLARCAEVQATRRTALARAYCEEARDLGQRRRDRHGVGEAQSLLAELQRVAEAR